MGAADELFAGVAEEFGTDTTETTGSGATTLRSSFVSTGAALARAVEELSTAATPIDGAGAVVSGASRDATIQRTTASVMPSAIDNATSTGTHGLGRRAAAFVCLDGTVTSIETFVAASVVTGTHPRPRRRTGANGMSAHASSSTV